MRPEDLTFTYLSFVLLYPPVPRFAGTEIPDFHARIHARHRFETLHAESDSRAFLTTEAQRSLEIERSRLEYSEHLRTAFDVARKNVVGLMGEVFDHFPVEHVRLPEIRLRALWPVPDELQPFSQTLQDRAVKLEEDQYKFIGDVHSVALTFYGTAEDPHRHWQFELGPWFTDPEQLFIEAEVQYFEAISKADVIGEHLQLAHDFVKGNVTHFVNSFMS